ncbi:MAG: Hpt domain-containing protein [Candidatus Magnetomorum sp.]|nr:Hpt domain-containing protein [Candidatus Magnetomorum sp.]
MLHLTFSSLSIISVLSLIIIVSVLIYKIRDLCQKLELEKRKTNELQTIFSECKSELSLTNDQMKIEISERKKRVDAYMQIKSELSERNTNRLNFLRNVGHEIRTPLNAINGMLTLLDETQLTNEQKEYLGISRYHTKEMLTLLNDINDFSDIKRGIEKKIASLSFSLQEMLYNLHNHLKHKAQTKKIVFTYSISENVPQYMCGDPIKLRKILFNLADNAIKFTNSGEISIKVYSVMQKEERFTLEFQISDTGIGIPKDIENLLFQSVFCQADTSLNRNYSGLGLGLAVAKELVSLLGGSISFQSQEIQGTTFTFTANFEHCPISDKEKTDVQTSDKPYKVFSFSDLKILLIEEKQIRVKIIQKILTEIGCQVDIALNLQQALAQFNSATYQALLFSFTKGKHPDAQWEKDIASSNFAKIPIVALARALPSDADQKSFQKKNIAFWLEVPINTRDLIDCIEKICRFSGDALHEINTEEDSLYQMIDKEAALAQLGDESLFYEVLQVFIDDLPAQINAMKMALDEHSFDQLSMHALSLKSSASTIMADQIKKVAFDIGVAGNENNIEKTKQLILHLEQTFEKLKKAYSKCSSF